MSTREQLNSRMNYLTESQLKALLALIDTMIPASEHHLKNTDVDSVMGILHEYANPDLIPQEKDAWAEAVSKKEENFWEGYHNETS